MKRIFDFQKVIINEFDPEKVSFDSEEVFISCDIGDKPDTAIELKMAFKDGNIYVLEEKIRPTRKNERLPYIWMVKNNEIELKREDQLECPRCNGVSEEEADLTKLCYNCDVDLHGM